MSVCRNLWEGTKVFVAFSKPPEFGDHSLLLNIKFVESVTLVIQNMQDYNSYSNLIRILQYQSLTQKFQKYPSNPLDFVRLNGLVETI